MPRLPRIQAVLIADQVLQEKGSNKWSVIGVFDRIYAHSFPVLHHTMGIYVRLTDAEGGYDVKLELQDALDRTIAVFGGIRLQVLDPKYSVDFGVQTRNLILTGPGKHLIRVYLNADLVDQVPLEVVLQPQGGPN